MSTPQPATSDLRVLLVDDHDDLLLMLGIMLKRKRGYAVETANSGHQAIALARDFSPHVVISDITMPGMNAFQMIDEMKTTKTAPFKSIALSGYAVSPGEQSGSAYDVHLTKPVDFDELFRVIDGLLESQNSSMPENINANGD